MSEPGDPDAGDWFRGRSAEAARAPRPVAEAFGHLRRTDAGAAGADGADGGSEWFEAEQAAAGQDAAVPAELPAEAPAAVEPAKLREISAAEQAPGEASASASAEAPAATEIADSDSAAPAEPPPPAESDSRVRLRALTGGLADLSDALAAIGVESVALRNAGPVPPPAVPAAASTPTADFRVRCPDCGPQYVAIADVRFVETGDGADANRYLFTCPACGARVRRPAGPELAEILKSSGVATLALRRGPGQGL